MLPADFRFQLIQLTFRAVQSVDLGDNPGSALRGALYGGLRERYCIPAGHEDRGDPSCPVCQLFALETENGAHGDRPPRPVVVRPPAESSFETGESFSFSVGLIGTAIDLLPVLLDGAANTSRLGLRRSPIAYLGSNPIAPFTSLPDDTLVTAGSLAALAESFPTNTLTLEFLTPTRLVHNGRLIHRPHVGILVKRLVERVQSFTGLAGGQSHYETLGVLADQATLGRDDTLWLEGWSGSSRTGRRSPLGGFVGHAHWTGDFSELMPWLLAGELVHVGKNAVKGNGWYRILVHRQ